jgi:hypothetical protein
MFTVPLKQVIINTILSLFQKTYIQALFCSNWLNDKVASLISVGRKFITRRLFRTGNQVVMKIELNM